MGNSAGRSGSRWRTLVANVRAAHAPCYLCGQPINYEAAYPAPDSFTVDHIQSWSGHPELREDPANLAPCHARCNGSKGKGDLPASLGIVSEAW